MLKTNVIAICDLCGCAEADDNIMHAIFVGKYSTRLLLVSLKGAVLNSTKHICNQCCLDVHCEVRINKL